jgi:hypothetical protein
MARYQNGSVRIEQRSDGPTWVYRFQVTRSDGRRVEHKTLLGLVRVVGPSEKDAWQEVDRQRLRENANGYHSRPNWAFENIPTLKTLGIARL